MRTKIQTIIFLILTSLSGFSQSVYYDVIALKKLKPTLQDDTVFFEIGIHKAAADILQKYTNATNYGGVEEAFADNPFIFLPSDKLQSSKALSGLKNIVGSAGSMDVTSLADGIARFLVERTKQELNITFFSKFAELIDRPEYVDARTLFPQTYATLKAIGSEVYTYEAYLSSLREAFVSDLNSLLPNLERLMKSDRYKKFFAEHKNLREVCFSAIYIGKQLQKKVHPGQIIADYPVKQIFPDTSNLRGSIEALRMLSESFRSNNQSHYWVEFDSIRTLLEDPTSLRIYAGILYQKSKSIWFVQDSKNISLQQLMKSVYNPKQKKEAEAFIESVKSWVTGFKENADNVELAIQDLKGKEKGKREFEDYYDLYTASLDLFEYAISVYQIKGLEELEPPESLYEKIASMRTGGMIALNITTRNYASAIMNLYTLYSECLEEKADTTKSFILKYGSFMAAVAQAENSEQVAAAIEAVALPSGSSRIKRESEFNVSLNSYVGFFWGREKVRGLDPNGSQLNAYGLTAPIGIAASWGHRFLFFETDCALSTSIFVSVVDIGAVAAFRYRNDSTETVPNIQLKDIISPGIFLSFGFPKSPISLNIGYQFGPLLREVKVTSNDYDKHYKRLSVSLCVDIPIVNFHTRSRDKELKRKE